MSPLRSLGKVLLSVKWLVTKNYRYNKNLSEIIKGNSKFQDVFVSSVGTAS